MLPPFVTPHRTRLYDKLNLEPIYYYLGSFHLRFGGSPLILLLIEHASSLSPHFVFDGLD